MQRLIIVLLLLGVVGLGIFLTPQPAMAQDGSGSTTQHTVQVGDTLYSIARHYNVTVASIVQSNPSLTNPNLIYLGQVLIIPSALPPTTPSPTTVPNVTATPSATTAPTSAPGQEVLHRVQTGENLFRIALRYGTTVQAVMQLNNIENPNVIYVGQELRVVTGTSTVPLDAALETATQTSTPPPITTEAPPSPASPEATSGVETTLEPSIEATIEPAATIEETPVATETELPATPEATEVAAETTPDTTGAITPPPAPNVPFDFGVQVELVGQNADFLVGRVEELGVHWVKQDILWSDFESTQGNIDFDKLDAIVDPLDAAGFSILLNISSAPAWARTSSQESGPSNNYQDYANFVGAVATRYQGRVDAYEIWREPNLRQNWNGKPISGAEYVALLRLAHLAIKTADPDAVVVSGGLAPTGLNDGVNGVDDRVFLRQMYQAGLAAVSDAIGAHSFGWANSPYSTCCETDPAIREWDDHKSFFFKDTLLDYRAIMVEFNDSGTFLWVTEFGWGSSGGFQLDVDPGLAFVDDVSLDEQMIYTLGAFQEGQKLGYIGPMFVWNLNSCQVHGLGSYQCYWSLLNPIGDPRPVFGAIRDMSK